MGFICLYLESDNTDVCNCSSHLDFSRKKCFWVMNHLILIQLSQKARQITLKKHPFLSISQRRKTRPHADNLQQRCLNLYIWISNNFHLIHNLYSSHSSAKLPCIVHCREKLWSCPPRKPLLCMTLMKTCLQSLDCHQSLTHRSSPGIRLDTCKACQTNEDPFLTIHTKWAFNIARGSRRRERELAHVYCLLPHLL